MKRLKHVVSLRRTRVDDGKDDRPYVGLENIESWTGRLLGNSAETEEHLSSITLEGESLSNLFEPGDVLFGKLRPYLAKAWVAEFPGRATTELLAMRPMGMESRFLCYVCLWHYFVETTDASTFGSKMPRADWNFIGNIPVPIPKWAAQCAIADYLDRETARLDELVAEKIRLAELLDEKRSALITRAVTRGVDPNVPLRDSGIPWLGKIPTHWDTQKFTRAVSIIEGQVDPESAPYVHWPLIAPNHVESETGRLLHRETAADQGAISGKYKCRANDVIYSKIRPALRKATLADRDSLCSADMYPLRPAKSLQPEYLLYLILSEPFSMWATLESARVAMPKINREALGNIKIPVPPQREQHAIVRFIEESVWQIDELRTVTTSTIRLLRERRSAIIEEAISGRIDVE